MSHLPLDAELLYAELKRGVQALLAGSAVTPHLVGIATGGAWLAERLQGDLGLPGPAGVISSTLHRDDYAQRGLRTQGLQTSLPFEVSGAQVLLIDDVLYTGRTLRAVINELYDYGRPACVRLAVLVDRGGRELPLAADFAAVRLPLDPALRFDLVRRPEGGFDFELASEAAAAAPAISAAPGNRLPGGAA